MQLNNCIMKIPVISTLLFPYVIDSLLICTKLNAKKLSTMMIWPTILLGASLTIRQTSCCCPHRNHFYSGKSRDWKPMVSVMVSASRMYLLQTKEKRQESGMVINRMRMRLAWSSGRKTVSGFCIKFYDSKSYNNHDHFKTSGFSVANFIMASPKSELAQANQARVIDFGLSMEKDSWMRLSPAWAMRPQRQERISWSSVEVKIWVMRASGQMLRGAVWELPTPLQLPDSQKQGLSLERTNSRVLRQMGSSRATNLRYARETRDGRLASSKMTVSPLPLTSQAKIFLPFFSATPYVQIAFLMRLPVSFMRLLRMAASRLKTEEVGTLSRTSEATSSRQVDIIALPGMLQAWSLGSSDGRKPVLIMPVSKEGFISPPASSLGSLQKVQNLRLLSFSYCRSLVCSSTTLMILLSAWMKRRLTKSSEAYLSWYSQASLRKEARESIQNLRSQMALVAYSFSLQRSTGTPKIRVVVLSLRQKCRCTLGFQNFLKALVQGSVMMSSA